MSNTPSTALAAEITAKTAEQIVVLINRNWPGIRERLEEDEGQIKLAFNVTITDRETEPGEHADKSNRIKTTISFSKRFTDSTEAALDDPSQPMLPSLSGPAHVPQVFNDEEGEEVHTDEIGNENAGRINLGDAIGAAAAGTDAPKIVLSLAGDWQPNVLVKAAKKAMKDAGWNTAQIDLLSEQLKACESASEMVATLRPHAVEIVGAEPQLDTPPL
jgi:hypothetical protein